MMRRARGLAATLAIAALPASFALPLAPHALAGAAAVRVAVFPFEIDVERQMGMAYGDNNASPSEAARLEKMTGQLRELLDKSGRYDIARLDGLSEAIHAAQPLYKCNGCEADLAAKAGAKQAITGTVQKSSDTLMNISIFVRDVTSGEVVNTMAVSVRENTDAGWQHGVRWLVKNRLLAKQ